MNNKHTSKYSSKEVSHFDMKPTPAVVSFSSKYLLLDRRNVNLAVWSAGTGTPFANTECRHIISIIVSLLLYYRYPYIYPLNFSCFGPLVDHPRGPVGRHLFVLHHYHSCAVLRYILLLYSYDRYCSNINITGQQYIFDSVFLTCNINSGRGPASQAFLLRNGVNFHVLVQYKHCCFF